MDQAYSTAPVACTGLW